MSSPVLGRRRLARDLRRRRIRSERTLVEVAEYLECSPAKISRLETGAVGVRARDLRALVELYDVRDAERDELYELLRQARSRGWWHEFADAYPPRSETLYGLEDAAASIWQHSSSLVPGLLQTEAYARALIGSAGPEPRLVERRLRLRMRRQHILTRPDPCSFHAVIDEAVLWRVIGGPAVMAEQLDALLELGRRPNVDIQVVEFAAGAHAAAGVSLTVFGFDIPTVTPVVYHEHLSGNLYLDDPADVDTAVSAWHSARSAAASTERSHDLIAYRVRQLRRGRPGGVELAGPHPLHEHQPLAEGEGQDGPARLL